MSLRIAALPEPEEPFIPENSISEDIGFLAAIGQWLVDKLSQLAQFISTSFLSCCSFFAGSNNEEQEQSDMDSDDDIDESLNFR